MPLGLISFKLLVNNKGNPARVVRAVSSEDRSFWKWGKQLYIDLAKKYRKQGLQPIEPD